MPAAAAITTDVAAAANALAAGKLVAFATETVYGLGADAANAAAVAKVYSAKNRPRNHPVIVHLADFAAAENWAKCIPDAARRLAQKFMPGPLTLLLPRQPHIRHLPGGDLIALRVPAHPQAQQLLQQFGKGVIAPSANRFGALSPTCAQDVAAEFAAENDLLILDGGRCPIGIESTIVGFAKESIYIARPGHISADNLMASGLNLVNPPATLRAPGRLPRHYAPVTPLLLVDNEVINTTIKQYPARKIGVLSFNQPTESVSQWYQASGNATLYAYELYRRLRALDEAQVDLILVALPPQQQGMWQAIHDRLKRAATDAAATSLIH